jgi:DNA-binding CsgD family transcriptional regulator
MTITYRGFEVTGSRKFRLVDGAARAGSRLLAPDPQETSTALALVRDDSVPRAHLLWVAAALLLEAIADDAPGDPDVACVLALERSLEPAEPLTKSEIRVLRCPPTHMGIPEIAAELCLSANTVRTHVKHLYRKLGGHLRREAVQRARAIGLLAAPPAGPKTPGGRTPRTGVTPSV